MYLKYYCLSRQPFGVTPDPAFLFLSESHREALASLLYGIERRKGFICICGEVGCGKTTVLKALLSRVNPDQVKTVYLFNPELSFENLMVAICEELGLEAAGTDLAGLVRRLHAHLIELYRQGKHVVLIVDEAHRMPVETLERLRILSNLETAQDKLLQIVLCGQPELEGVLATRQLRQLRERIAVRATVRPLTASQSLEYAQHRLGRVAYGTTPVFEPVALKLIVRHAQGNPRRINILCDNALVAGYAEQKRPIPVKVVRDVIGGARLQRRPGSLGKRVVWASAATLFVVAGALGALALYNMRGAAAAVESFQPATRVHVDVEKVAPVVAPAAPDVRKEQGEGEEVLALVDLDLKVLPDLAYGENLVPAPGTEAAAPPASPSPKRETVMAGDTLTRLLTRVYGRVNRGLVERTLKMNPQVTDADRIRVGDSIVLPETSEGELLHE